RHPPADVPRVRAPGGERMSGRSAANPEDLQTFVTQAGGATTDLGTWVERLTKNFNAFQSSGSVGVVTQSAVGTIPAFLGRQRANDTFVSLVRQAFLNADGGVLDGGVIRVPDAALQSAFERIARHYGIDPAQL